MNPEPVETLTDAVWLYIGKEQPDQLWLTQEQIDLMNREMSDPGAVQVGRLFIGVPVVLIEPSGDEQRQIQGRAHFAAIEYQQVLRRRRG